MQDPFEKSLINKLLVRGVEPTSKELKKAHKELVKNPAYIHRILEKEWDRCLKAGTPDQYLRVSQTPAYRLVALYLDKIQPAFSPAQLQSYAKNPDLLMEQFDGKSPVPDQLVTNFNMLYRPMMAYYNQHQDLASQNFANSKNDWRLGIVKPAIFGVLFSHLRRSSESMVAKDPVHNEKYITALSKSFIDDASPSQSKVNPNIPAAIFIEKQLGTQQSNSLELNDAELGSEFKKAVSARSYKAARGEEQVADIRVVPSISAMRGFSNLVQEVFNSMTRDTELVNQPVANSPMIQQPDTSPLNPQATGIAARAAQWKDTLLIGISHLEQLISDLNARPFDTKTALGQSTECVMMLSKIIEHTIPLGNEPTKILGDQDSKKVTEAITKLTEKMTAILSDPSVKDSKVIDKVIEDATKFEKLVDQASQKGLIDPKVHENFTVAISASRSSQDHYDL